MNDKNENISPVLGAIDNGVLNKIKFNDQGLVVAIATDVNTNEVLMQAFMNKESLELTIKTRRAHYFSRSRNQIWLKGETSGHFQDVVSIAADCDCDSILIRVVQSGVACHTGAKSCYFNNIVRFENRANINILQDNIDTIKERKLAPIEGSYTNYLLNKGVEKISKKIGEEASECIIAAMKNDNAELSCEIADLLYHSFVLMEAQGLFFNDVLTVLEERHSKERKRNY